MKKRPLRLDPHEVENHSPASGYPAHASESCPWTVPGTVLMDVGHRAEGMTSQATVRSVNAFQEQQKHPI